MTDSEVTPISLDLSALLTVVLTTSPVVSQPSTGLIDAVVDSFTFAAGLSQCRTLIVCDGFKLKSDGKSRRESRKSYRQGVITAEHVSKYEEYKRRLHEKSKSGVDARYANATIIELQRHHGFGFAVLAALRRVQTPLVMVVQHDRTLMREVPLSRIVQVLQGFDDVNMVSFLTRSTMQHVLRVQSRHAQKESRCTDSEWQALQEPHWKGGLRLVPMLQWLDSTHIAKVDFYKRIVFQPGLIKRGSFIEDKIGNMMLDDLRLRGAEAHRTYATWIFDDESMEPMVKHAHGRAFLTDDLRRARIEVSLEEKNCSSSRGSDGESNGCENIEESNAESNEDNEGRENETAVANGGGCQERCDSSIGEMKDALVGCTSTP